MPTPIIAVAITVSDRCASGEQKDLSGAALVELLREAGAEIIAHEVPAADSSQLWDVAVGRGQDLGPTWRH